MNSIEDWPRKRTRSGCHGGLGENSATPDFGLSPDISQIRPGSARASRAAWGASPQACTDYFHHTVGSVDAATVGEAPTGTREGACAPSLKCEISGLKPLNPGRPQSASPWFMVSLHSLCARIGTMNLVAAPVKARSASCKLSCRFTAAATNRQFMESLSGAVAPASMWSLIC